jgi:hypothetical protein
MVQSGDLFSIDECNFISLFFFVLLGFSLWLKKVKKSCLLHKYSADSATFPALPLQLRSVACEQWTPINNEDRDIER